MARPDPGCCVRCGRPLRTTRSPFCVPCRLNLRPPDGGATSPVAA